MRQYWVNLSQARLTDTSNRDKLSYARLTGILGTGHKLAEMFDDQSNLQDVLMPVPKSARKMRRSKLVPMTSYLRSMIGSLCRQ